MHDRKLTYGRTTAKARGAITNYDATWPEIVDLFREPVRRKITTEEYQAMSAKDRAHSKNTGLFFGGRCKDGRRSDGTLAARSIVNLDIDSSSDEIWDDLMMTDGLSPLDGLAYLVHTTRSHTDETPKMRVLVPLARDVTAAEYEPVARALAEMLDPKMLAVARESYPPAQGMYFPSVSRDQEYHFYAPEGELFDPDAALVKYPADDASRWPRAARETVTEYRPGRQMTHPEDKKVQAPIITAVYRAFDPWTFIDEFLGDIYVPSGDRYYPIGATGAPSVRIYDDTFIQSDHGSDPAVGQHNVFDLGRIHLFRHLDDEYDIASMTPSEWPSHKAMADFMMERPEVVEQLHLVEHEVQSEHAQAALDLLADLGDEDDDDPVGSTSDGADDDDDLIGEPPAKAEPTIEDVLRKVRLTIERAESLNDLDRRLEKIRAISTNTLRDFHRDMVVTTLQKRMQELTGEKPAKPVAKKMLAPTIENLRDQMSDEPTPEWLEDWVFLTGEGLMFNLVTKEAMNRESFNGAFNKNTGDEFGSNEMGVAKLSAFDAATQVFCVPKPYRLRYHPAQPALFSEDGIQYANSYRAPVITASSYKGKKGVKYLLRLIADLFPQKQHQDMLLDFMAHCRRHPGRKLRYAVLVKGSEDEGKSLIGTLIGKMVGANNFGIVGTDQLMEKYNSWSDQRVFALIEEIKLPGKEAPMVLNKLKPVVSNHEVPIRKMRTDVTTERNFCNLLLTTNYEDCLPLEDDNTRYLVLFTRFQTNKQVKAWRQKRVDGEGFDYVRELFEHIHSHPRQFVEYFESYEFSEQYDPGARAPWTEFKARMAEDAKTDERRLLEDMLEDEDQPAINDDFLIWSAFEDAMAARGIGHRLKGRAVAGFLKPLGFVRCADTRYSVDKKASKLRLWTRNLDAVDADGHLRPEIKQRAIEIAMERDDMADLEDMVGNVVPLRK